MPTYTSSIFFICINLFTYKLTIEQPHRSTNAENETIPGITYQKLDLVLAALKKGLPDDTICERVKVAPEILTRVRQLTELSARLRNPIPYPALR